MQHPVQLQKGHKNVAVPCRKDEWADEDVAIT